MEKTRFKEANYEAFAQCMPMYARKEKPRTVVAGYTILFVDKVGCALPLPK